MPEHWAARYVGMPFVHGGRERAGIDCYGLVRMVYSEILKVDLPLLGEFSEATAGECSAKMVEESGRAWAEVSVPEEFDVVVLRLGGRPLHLGLVIEPDRMLHAWDGIGSRIERIGGPVWRRRINGFYRYIGNV